MGLAVFDLDETLISTDSDHAWGVYAADVGLVDGDAYREQNELFYQDYKRGELDVDAYLRFSCAVLAAHPMPVLKQHQKRFFEERIESHLLPAAKELISKHRDLGDTLIVVTATNRFITELIAEAFGIEHLIAPEPEMIDGRYTGEITGVPSMGPGKVVRLKAWCEENRVPLSPSTFYSDSINDLPLLETVDTPITVDPDDRLRKVAEERKWSIISLR